MTMEAEIKMLDVRYQNLEHRLDEVEKKLSKLEDKIGDLKDESHRGFSEIKLLLEQRNTQKQTQIIASAATIIAALLSVIGYILYKH